MYQLYKGKLSLLTAQEKAKHLLWDTKL